MHSSVLTQPSAFTLEPLEPLLLFYDKHSYPDTSERPKFQVSPSRSVAGVKEAWILMLPWFTPLTQSNSAVIVCCSGFLKRGGVRRCEGNYAESRGSPILHTVLISEAGQRI